MTTVNITTILGIRREGIRVVSFRSISSRRSSSSNSNNELSRQVISSIPYPRFHQRTQTHFDHYEFELEETTQI